MGLFEDALASSKRRRGIKLTNAAIDNMIAPGKPGSSDTSAIDKLLVAKIKQKTKGRR